MSVVPVLLLSLVLARPVPPQTSPTLATRIERLFHDSMTADDDAKQILEAKQIYADRGLPTIAAVGDEASYEFAVLLMSKKLSLDLRSQIALHLRGAAATHEVPADAAAFYEARLRLERIKESADAHPPGNPDLRDEIERMTASDQAVRQLRGFDADAMTRLDRQNAHPLQAILDKFGVPTFSMVGPKAAGDFVALIQHQPAQFRARALPGLKSNVEAGEADPEGYSLVYDRSQRDLGRKQLYGQQLECDAGKKMHEAPIEDEGHVNRRRAELGLIRVELYARIAAEMMPQFCAPREAQPHA
jgi:hypothetical protein